MSEYQTVYPWISDSLAALMAVTIPSVSSIPPPISMPRMPLHFRVPDVNKLNAPKTVAIS